MRVKLRNASASHSLDSGQFAGSCLRDYQAWETPTSVPALDTRQVHVWMVDRQQLSPRALTQFAPFSRQELERAEVYHFERDRLRYQAGRAVLRHLLAGYLEIRPTDVPLTLGADGKPHLAPPNLKEFQVNLTHAAQFTLIAVTRQAAVGVDLEAVEAKPGGIKLAPLILSESELADFEALPEHLKLDRFYQLWTTKEAVLKALGTGFLRDPQKLEIGVALDPIGVRRIDFDGQDRGRWTLIQLPAVGGFAATLAVEGEGWSWACWKYSGLPRG